MQPDSETFQLFNYDLQKNIKIQILINFPFVLLQKIFVSYFHNISYTGTKEPGKLGSPTLGKSNLIWKRVLFSGFIVLFLSSSINCLNYYEPRSKCDRSGAMLPRLITTGHKGQLEDLFRNFLSVLIRRPNAILIKITFWTAYWKNIHLGFLLNATKNYWWAVHWRNQ